MRCPDASLKALTHGLRRHSVQAQPGYAHQHDVRRHEKPLCSDLSGIISRFVVLLLCYGMMVVMAERSRMPWQEIRHLKAAKAARDQELLEAQKQLEAERFQVEELERNLLSQVGPSAAHTCTSLLIST